MKKAVQGVAALNALFGLVVGLLCVAGPATAAAAFQIDAGAPAVHALVRMFGGLLAASGIVSALLAKDPSRDAGLVVGYAACLLVNVTADSVVIAAGELRFDQLAGGMVIQALLAGLLLVHRGR
jgi:hypothetical protein